MTDLPVSNMGVLTVTPGVPTPITDSFEFYINGKRYTTIHNLTEKSARGIADLHGTNTNSLVTYKKVEK